MAQVVTREEVEILIAQSGYNRLSKKEILQKLEAAGYTLTPDARERLDPGSTTKEQRDIAETELFRTAMTLPGGGGWIDPATGAAFEGTPAEPVPEYIEEEAMDPLVFDQLGPSAMADVNANPWAVQAQWDALAGMRDIYNQGGLTAIDRARIAEARAGEDAYLRGQRESTLADMQARGMGGSGMELLSQLAAQQEAGQRMASAGLETEAMALARRDAALKGAGDFSTLLRDQQWDEDVAKAEARDAVDRLNWGASNTAKTAVWDAERGRRERTVAGKNDRAVYKYESPWREAETRAGILSGSVGTSVDRYDAATRRREQELAERQYDDSQSTGAKVLDFFKGAVEGFG